MTNQNDIVAVAAVRTPIGSFGGTLRDVPAYDLGAAAIRAVAKAGCFRAAMGTSDHGEADSVRLNTT